MTNLYTLSEEELAERLVSWGERRFRAKQIWAWMYDKGATSFDDMSDLPKSLRQRLETEASLGVLQVATEQVASDGTVKRLYRLGDGQLIESVLMAYRDNRRTACISSQAGCALGCVFCATGQMGFARHLTATEIFEQAQRFSQDLRGRGERLSNVVLMGMGEPFHNYEPVIDAVRRLMSDLGIGARHITISTVGLVPEIRRFAEEGLQVGLAISLHETTDDERSALLPVNKRWPIRQLIEACHFYQERTNRRVSFEWALIAGKNDDEPTAHQLGRLLRGLKCHVNLIPLNPTEDYDGSPTDDAEAFVDALAQHGVPATLRVRRGIDIDAGCGQLRASLQEPH